MMISARTRGQMVILPSPYKIHGSLTAPWSRVADVGRIASAQSAHPARQFRPTSSRWPSGGVEFPLVAGYVQRDAQVRRRKPAAQADRSRSRLLKSKCNHDRQQVAEAAGSRAAASGQRTSASPSMPERQLRGKLDGRNGSVVLVRGIEDLPFEGAGFRATGFGMVAGAQLAQGGHQRWPGTCT